MTNHIIANKYLILSFSFGYTSLGPTLGDEMMVIQFEIQVDKGQIWQAGSDSNTFFFKRIPNQMQFYFT